MIDEELMDGYLVLPKLVIPIIFFRDQPYLWRFHETKTFFKLKDLAVLLKFCVHLAY